MQQELNNESSDGPAYEIFKALFCLSSFIKEYQSHIEDGLDTVVVRYYDEREWRYVPSNFLSDCFDLCLNKDDFKIPEKVQAKNSLMEDNPLKYDCKDINYIIVDSESEVLEMRNSIEDIYGRLYSKKDVEVLETKIISSERILSDF